MAYTDIGFDEFLNRLPVSQNSFQEMDPLESDTFIPQLSGSKVQGGILSSPDGRIKLDLDQGIFKVSNGVQDLVNFGVLSDGSVGLLISDAEGNTLMQVSQGVFFLESSNKVMKIDFILGQCVVRDNKGNVRVLFGFDPQGF